LHLFARESSCINQPTGCFLFGYRLNSLADVR
jgi:hypothetical protein